MTWIEYNETTGRILQRVEAIGTPQAEMGGVVMTADLSIEQLVQHIVVEGVLLDIGPQPTPSHYIDYAARAWVLDQTDAEKIEAVRVRLQRVMDDAARALGYDDLKSVIGYRGDPNPKFAGEAEAFFVWRSNVWTDCYAHPAFSGQAPIPTPDEAEALMPPLELP